MFDLNQAIADWRRHLEQDKNIAWRDIDELESHLRDALGELAQVGPVTEDAFNEAVHRFGNLEKLSEEFCKVRSEGFGSTSVVGGEMLTMISDRKFRGDRLVTLLFFVGFCGIIGWLGTTCWLLHGWTNSRHWASWSIMLRMVSMFALWSSFFLIFALIGIPWGVRLVRKTEQKSKIFVRSLIPAVVLSPVYIIGGMVIIFLTPYVGGWVKTLFVGPKIVQSAVSPDGRFEAYVVSKPSIDPPNHQLYIRRVDTSHYVGRKAATLPEDVDSIQKIHWSPHSDIVVFQTWFSLIVARASDYKMVKIPLGGEWHWRKNGTFWVDYNDVEQIAAMDFPSLSAFSYRFVSSDEFKTIDMDSF